MGDSLQRGQWQSFVCLVESYIPAEQKSMRRGRALSVFKAKVLITKALPELGFCFQAYFQLVANRTSYGHRPDPIF